MQQNLKVTIVLGDIVLVLNSSGWLLWLYVVLIMIILWGVIMYVIGSYWGLLLSYMVEILRLDINKTRWVDVDLPLDILVFFEETQIPICSRI